MAAEGMDMAETLRNAALAHHNRDLMQGFRQQRPEIPIVIGAAHAGARITFDGVVEIWKPQRITEEKHRRVVADNIPIALLSVELHGKAADVALGIGSAALTCDCGKPGKHRDLLADR